MVDKYIKTLRKRFSLDKKVDMGSILVNNEVNLSQPIDGGKCLIHLLIFEEDL